MRRAAAREPLLIGDLVLFELLQGARDEVHAARIEQGVRQYAQVSLLDPALAASAARNYRQLRGIGITVRKSADMIIGTYCIENRHTSLHDDRDFAPMKTHLGLRLA